MGFIVVLFITSTDEMTFKVYKGQRTELSAISNKLNEYNLAKTRQFLMCRVYTTASYLIAFTFVH